MSHWRELPAPNRRWLVVNALGVTAAINLVINWALSAGAVRSVDTVPMRGAPLVETSTFWTVIGTLFLLPLFTCVLATTSVRRDLRRGSLAPPVLLVLLIAGFPDLDPDRYVAYQVVFAILLGMIVTPLIALAAMAE